jgi:methionine aminotransferase
MHIESKLPQVGTTVFTVMSALAARYGAVNLGQGFPDFDCDRELQSLLAQAVAAGHNQYAPMAGVPALREAVAAKTERLYGRRYDAEREVSVTAGATQAIMAAVLAVVRPGDEVIVLEPTYDSYVPSILLAGGTPVYVPLDHARGYAPDWSRVRSAITPKTRLLMLNFPHNPSGYCLTAADLAALEELLRDNDVLLMSDEVYEHIVFDGRPHQSLARSPQLAERTFVISSFGKTFHITGWKVATCCAPAALTAELRKVHQFMVFAVNAPAQHALAGFLARAERYESLPAFYQAKRDLFVAGLARTRLRPLACPGTYFVLADYSAVSDEPEASFAERLVREHGVAAIPIAGLYAQPFDNRIVRFCFAKKDDTLRAALARLAEV